MDKVRSIAKKVLFLFLGILIFGTIYHYSDVQLSSILDRLEIIAVAPFLVFLGFFILFHLLRSALWRQVSLLFCPEIRFPRFFFALYQLLSLGGFVVASSAAGFSIKVAALAKVARVGLRLGTAICGIETMLLVILLGLMTPVSILFVFYPDKQVFLYALALLLFVLFITLGIVRVRLPRHQIFRRLTRAARHLTHYALAQILSVDASEVSVRFKQLRGAPTMFTLAVLIYVTPPIYYFFLSSALNIDLELGKIFLVFPVVYVSSILSFTPAGIGIKEAGNSGALMILGVPAPEAVIFSLAIRAFGDGAQLILSAIAYLLVVLMGLRTEVGYSKTE